MTRQRVPVSRRNKDGSSSACGPSNEIVECRDWAAGFPDTTEAWAKLESHQGNMAPGHQLEGCMKNMVKLAKFRNCSAPSRRFGGF